MSTAAENQVGVARDRASCRHSRSVHFGPEGGQQLTCGNQARWATDESATSCSVFQFLQCQFSRLPIRQKSCVSGRKSCVAGLLGPSDCKGANNPPRYSEPAICTWHADSVSTRPQTKVASVRRRYDGVGFVRDCWRPAWHLTLAFARIGSKFRPISPLPEGSCDASVVWLADHAGSRDDRAGRRADRRLDRADRARDRAVGRLLGAAVGRHHVSGAGAGRRGAVPVDFDQGHPAQPAAVELHRQREPRAEVADRLAEALPANALAPQRDRGAAGQLLSLHARRRRAARLADQPHARRRAARSAAGRNRHRRRRAVERAAQLRRDGLPALSPADRDGAAER